MLHTTLYENPQYNGNNGYIGDQKGMDPEQKCWWGVAQAFSHYTYHSSGGDSLVSPAPTIGVQPFRVDGPLDSNFPLAFQVFRCPPFSIAKREETT